MGYKMVTWGKGYCFFLRCVVSCKQDVYSKTIIHTFYFSNLKDHVLCNYISLLYLRIIKFNSKHGKPVIKRLSFYSKHLTADHTLINLKSQHFL